MPDLRQIVFLMTDTQRYDMLGCVGTPGMRTPRLDRLAAEGVRFDRAYTCQPVCGPARAAIFTGLFPHGTGAWGNSLALGDNVKTVGQRLRDRGLHTAYIGKWHLDGGDYFGLGRCPDGWDPAYWYDMRNYLEELAPEERLESRSAALNADPALTAAFTFGRRCSNRAIEFLSRHGRDDFLLVVSYDEPHGPCVCPEPFASMYRDYAFPKRRNVWDRLEDKPEHLRVWAGEAMRRDRDAVEIRRPAYFGCNSFVDDEIGRVLDAVDRHAPGALVVYTSDHGDGLESHCLSGKGPCVFDEIARVPLIVRWPGRAPQGVVCPHPVSHIDLAPTLLEAAAVPLPKWMDGRSLVPCLRDPAVRANDAVFIEFGRYEIDHDGFGGFQPMRAVFDGRYKLAVHLNSGDELYDLREDPDEMVNLIACDRLRPVRDGLHDRLLRWMNETRDPFRGYVWERRPWRTDAPPAVWRCAGMTRQRENEEYEPRQLDYDTGLPMTAATRRK
jgi:uncharacterized sulfatase